VANRIALDVDAVACPFLEVTEVFNDTDWEQLVYTVSMEARAAIARRSDLTERVTLALVRIGEAKVAATLLDNESAPLGLDGYSVLIDRFENDASVLERMATRKAALCLTSAPMGQIGVIA